MNKKAQGLSLQTIIIAALVIIVLIVLIGIFTGYLGKWVPQFAGATEQRCEGEGFDSAKSQCDPESETQVFGNFGDSIEPGKVCCRATLCTDYPNHECLPPTFTGKQIWEDSCLSCSSGKCYATGSISNRVCK